MAVARSSSPRATYDLRFRFGAGETVAMDGMSEGKAETRVVSARGGWDDLEGDLDGENPGEGQLTFAVLFGPVTQPSGGDSLSEVPT